LDYYYESIEKKKKLKVQKLRVGPVEMHLKIAKFEGMERRNKNIFGKSKSPRLLERSQLKN
jgi:hypothetical protein